MAMSNIVPEILLRCLVKDLLRCKSVCKSWYYLISSPAFVKTHVKYICNKEECNVSRRIAMIDPWVSTSKGGYLPVEWHSYAGWRMMGSCNGLVCMVKDRICVTNPLTREFRKLQLPLNFFNDRRCFGFGYDSYTDDYKVVMAISQGRDRTLVLVLSLKSNIWKLMGHVNYRFDNYTLLTHGILFNGALHWFWHDANDSRDDKILIVSFDFAKEEFREIPQPDDSRYVWNYNYSLGIMDGHLCIFHLHDYDHDFPSCGTWVMKSYNSWELFPNDCEMKDHGIHYMLKDTNQSTKMPTYFCDENIQLSRSMEHIQSPIFMPTLVSPYVNNNGGPSHTKNNKSIANAGSVQVHPSSLVPIGSRGDEALHPEINNTKTFCFQQEKREIQEVYSVEDKEEKNQSSLVIEMVMSDVVEEILLRLQVEDLLRCKSVCKSWYSLISSPSFVKCHTKSICNKEEYNRRKIDMITDYHNWRMKGSSNGLVCIYSRARMCVINPLTREFREIQQPPKKIPKESQCFGFGYDSLADDYKVVLAICQQGKALVHVLCLKSNIWTLFGQVNYRFDDGFLVKPGILFNGALHWFWLNPNDTTRENILLVSFDLAKEEFREIPQPDDTRYVWNYGYSLGIIERRLCIFPAFDEDDFPSCGIWVMKSYNSWELFPNDCEMRDYAIHYMLKDTIQSKIMPTYFCDENKQLSRGKEHIGCPMFVQTLVSPYVNNNGRSSHTKNNKSTANAGIVKEQREIKEVYKEEEKEYFIDLLEVDGRLKYSKSRN